MILAEYSSGADSIAQFVTVILIFLIVLALAYFTTRFVGSYQKTRLANKNFEAIETFRITNGKYLQLLKAGSKYIVIGIGKDSITMICELSEEEVFVSPNEPIMPTSDSFKAIMEKAREKLTKGGNKHDE